MLKVQFHLWTFKSSKKQFFASIKPSQISSDLQEVIMQVLTKKIKILFGGSSTDAKVCGKLVHIWATTIV